MNATAKVTSALVVFVLSSCQGGESRVGSTTEGISVLSIELADTVFLFRGDQNRLVWERAVGRSWQADSLLDARPKATLLFANEDSLPDLFFTIQWEEFILGELWLGEQAAERQVFRSAEDACRIPEMRDVDADGRLDVIDWRAGALEMDECTGDVPAEQCQAVYPTEWPELWMQRADGTFVQDGSLAPEFYGALSRNYAAAADRLRLELMDSTGSGAPPSTRCDQDMLRALEDMARRAGELAGRR